MDETRRGQRFTCRRPPTASVPLSCNGCPSGRAYPRAWCRFRTAMADTLALSAAGAIPDSGAAMPCMRRTRRGSAATASAMATGWSHYADPGWPARVIDRSAVPGSASRFASCIRGYSLTLFARTAWAVHCAWSCETRHAGQHSGLAGFRFTGGQPLARLICIGFVAIALGCTPHRRTQPGASCWRN